MFKKKSTELNRSFSGSTASSSSSSPGSSSRNATVLAVECISGGTCSSSSFDANEWSGVLLTGDIVEEIQIGNQLHRSPFRDGTPGVQKLLRRCFRDRQVSITVRVRRSGGGGVTGQMQAFIAESGSGGKTQYVLRGVHHPQYAVRFFDRTEAECFQLQATRNTKVHEALYTAELKDGYVNYPWERRMIALLKPPNSSSFLSILFFPKASSHSRDSRYHDIDHTLARANAWLIASQASGVPIAFSNIQTESLLTKLSGESSSSIANIKSISDLPNVANTSLYGFEDYHGVDIGMVRAVRLWYSSLAEEYRVTVDIHEGDTKLGFAISRTEEGFIYIISVIEGDVDGPSSRSGLTDLHKEARDAGKLLVISRINNQQVLPWLVSSSGEIRCFDTVSLSQKLSLHRHAGVPLLIHVFMWGPPLTTTPLPTITTPAAAAPTPPVQLQSRHDVDDYDNIGCYEPVLLQGKEGNKRAQGQVSDEDGDDDDDDAVQVRVLERSGAGGDASSFRFDHFQCTDSWA